LKGKRPTRWSQRQGQRAIRGSPDSRGKKNRSEGDDLPEEGDKEKKLTHKKVKMCT